MKHRNDAIKEEAHDQTMVAESWSKKLAHYGCYFINLKRENQILNRMDRMCGDLNYYA